MFKTLVRLCLVTALFVSGSIGFAQDAPLEIKFLHIFAGLGGEQVNGAVEAFNASQSEIVVVPETVEGSYEAILERLQLSTMAGDLPDVTLTGLTYTQFAIENLPVIPAQTFIDAEGTDLSGYFEQLLALGRAPDGSQFGMPFVISNPVVFYNIALFEAAGITEVPTTVEEIREAGMMLTDAANEQFGIFYDYTVTGNWIFQAMVETYGGSMLDENGAPAFDSDAGRAALQYWVDMVNVDRSMPAINGQQAIQLFAAGKLGMLITSSAATGALDSLSEFPVGVAEFPFANGNRVIPAGGNNLIVIETGDEARQQAAWTFVKFMTSAEINAPLANGIGYMTVSQTAVETPAILGDVLAADARFQVPYNQLIDTVPWYNLPGDAGSRVYSIVQDNIDAALTQQKTVEQALADAQTQINDLLN